MLLFFQAAARGQEGVIPLWEGKIPNSRPLPEGRKPGEKDIPSISVYLPSRSQNTRRAVVICPGGGYGGLAFEKEGTDIAKWLNSRGAAGIVLKYRLPDPRTSILPWKTPLLDVQRAIRLVRADAGKWGIDPGKVGVMGFSAGGHLASTAATHFDMGIEDSKDPVERWSCRPDFVILGYPVITMEKGVTHMGSRRRLLGGNPPSELVERFSNEKQVTEETPPAFLFLAADDRAVPPENSLRFFRALAAHGVPAELHIYPYGGHGFGLAVGRGHLQSWTQALALWLQWLDRPAGPRKRKGPRTNRKGRK